MGRRLTGRTGTFSHLERYNPFDDSINNDKKNLGCGRINAVKEKEKYETISCNCRQAKCW